LYSLKKMNKNGWFFLFSKNVHGSWPLVVCGFSEVV